MTRTSYARTAVAALVAVLTAVVGLANPANARADSVRDGQWYLNPLGITRAHAIARGDGIKVAVIDSGVDGSVPDLRGAVVGGKDFSGQGTADGQTPIDGDRHGTEVASLLAARGHGTGGSAGVLGSAPGVQLLSASINISADNAATQINAAVRWAVDQGAQVINFSIQAGDLGKYQDALVYAQSRDVVSVGGAGNGGLPDAQAPATVPGVVCVGGIDKNLKHDPEANSDPRMGVVGPFATVAHVSSNPRDGLPVAEPGSAPTQYDGKTGTSLATPVVAGVVALIRQKFPDLDAANVVNRLIRTATPAGNGRPNDEYGYGIVNAYRALTADVPTVTQNPLGSLPTPQATPTSKQPTSSAATSPTEQPSTATPPPPVASSDSGPNTGLIVGIIAAVVIGAGIAASVIVRSRKRRTPTGWPAANRL